MKYRLISYSMANSRMPIAINRIKIMLLTTNNNEVSINGAVILYPEKNSNTFNKFLCSVPLDFRQKVKNNPSTTNLNNKFSERYSYFRYQYCKRFDTFPPKELGESNCINAIKSIKNNK